MAAGLLARNAVAKGLTVKPWVKTSLAPGSQVVAEYLAKSGLQKDLDKLGFNLVGFGCTTCIGNSGPLPSADLEGDQRAGPDRRRRASPATATSRAASPGRAGELPGLAAAGRRLCAGRLRPDGPDHRAARHQPDGKPVYLKDIWPSNKEIQQLHRQNVTRAIFEAKYADVFKGDAQLAGGQDPAPARPTPGRTSLDLRPEPALFPRHHQDPEPGHRHRRRPHPRPVRRQDHHRPHLAGRLDQGGFACRRNISDEHGVAVADFNQYGTRRGNHEVMMRGTFANIRIRNHMMGPNGREGGYTIHYPSKEELPIYDAAMRYQAEKVPLVDLRRRRIRQRLVARLGREGHQPARRQGRDRPELRAHPPLEPGRHGRRAVHPAGRAPAGPRSASRATRP
jgi:aconitate hydratase